MKEYYNYCLKANLPLAIRAIKKSKDVKSKILMSKVKDRFIQKSEQSYLRCDDSFVKAVIEVYRKYYLKALLQPKKIQLFDDFLNVELQNVMQLSGIKLSKNISFGKIENLLKIEFKQRGFFAIFGTVTPFKSLMVWKKQSSKTYKVQLPEGVQTVNVIFLEQFIEFGWLHYATFGKYYVGGWAKKTSLYCVKKAYKVGSPTFKVHYLAHEAQHFSDYKVFPKLKQVDLEYRAKLSELSLTKNTAKFILKLKSEAKNDSSLPHSFAAFCIMEKLSDSDSPKELRSKAVQLLFEHSHLLKKFGRKKIESALLPSTCGAPS